MARLRIVLVEPQEAGNVGAVARVMKNFGFQELWIVGEHPKLEPVAGWWASGAEDVIAKARMVPTLHHAIGDAQMTIATTSARGRTTPVDLELFDVADIPLADDAVLALVFGREDRGLTREEVVQCQRTATIPTNPDFPTMNLAMAVGMFCLSVAAGALAGQGARGARPHTDRAESALLERLHERAEALLLEVGFLQANNPDRIYDDLRAIAGRADLDAREATILLGIIRQIEWKLGR
ncbi:MAG TPA: TrmJ/YjtD family RNA methyltransferase [Thermoanaerobaculia bacterium]|nr:TrmJ/YjtD family RNA methyltransferase [Thermoanaerobaculia bacterium]